MKKVKEEDYVIGKGKTALESVLDLMRLLKEKGEGD